MALQQVASGLGQQRNAPRGIVTWTFSNRKLLVSDSRSRIFALFPLEIIYIALVSSVLSEFTRVN